MATKAVGVDLDQLAKEDLGDPIVMWSLCAALWKNFVSFLSMDHICKLSVTFCWKTGLVSISLLTHLSLDGLVGVNFIFGAMT